MQVDIDKLIEAASPTGEATDPFTIKVGDLVFAPRRMLVADIMAGTEAIKSGDSTKIKIVVDSLTDDGRFHAAPLQAKVAAWMAVRAYWNQVVSKKFSAVAAAAATAGATAALAKAEAIQSN